MRGTGVVVDLSVAGCRISSASPVKPGELLGVLIEPPRCVDTLYITRALVRWANGQEFGLEFLLMDLRDRQRLDEMVCSRGWITAAAGQAY